MQNSNADLFPRIIAQAVTLECAGKVKLVLHYRHNCSEELMGRSPFSKGFPALPLTCPHCNKRLVDYDEMGFSFAIGVGVSPYKEIPDPSKTEELKEFLKWVEGL